MHTIKYYQKELLSKANNHIEKTARDNKDHNGKLNYLLAFLDICESNLSYIEEMIQVDEVVTRAINGGNPPPVKMGTRLTKAEAIIEADAAKISTNTTIADPKTTIPAIGFTKKL